MSNLDPIRKLLSFSLPHKPCEISSRIARISLIICLLSFLILILHTTQRTNWLRYPNPNNSIRFLPDTNPAPTNISHLLFGIGGSSATWRDRSDYSSLWWDPNTTRGFVWLDEEPEEETMKYLAKKSGPGYKISSREWTRFKFSSSRSAVRIARIISDSFKLGLPNVRWFVMGDDDTVYFAHNLVSVLSRYDHNEMWYIGGNSESVEQDEVHSYDMAFGGGGFAISFPLAERLVSVLDGCLDRYFNFYGSDQRIWACASEIGVSLTRECGFHQFDIRGNPYGLLAAHPQAPLVSLHHLDHLDPLFPNQSRKDSLYSLFGSYRIDPARILQQTFCHDYDRKWSISISWGYTVQLYPSLVPAKDLQRPLRTFKTWRSLSNGPFTFNTRPVPSNLCERPVAFMMDRAEEVGRGKTQTSYKNVGPLFGKRCGSPTYDQAMLVQRIIVSSEKLETDFWTKGPRRQCCEFADGGRINNNSIHIKIRKCRSWETVTS